MVKAEEKLWGMQDMYTRRISANLDFDSELQHVFCWEPDECRVSRVFHVDRVFLRLRCTLFLVSGLGASNVTLGWHFLTSTHVFWSRYVLLDPARTQVFLVLSLSGRQRWTSAEHVALSISVYLLSPFYSALSQSVFLERYREDYRVPALVLTPINREKCSQVSCCTVSAM